MRTKNFLITGAVAGCPADTGGSRVSPRGRRCLRVLPAGLGDVAGGEAVDDLDLLLVLGVCHELEYQRVDGQGVEFAGE